MSEKSFAQLTAEVMNDRQYQNVNVRTVDLWLLLCAVQYVVWVKQIHGPLKEGYRDLGGRLEAILKTLHPDVAPLIDAGWDNTVEIDALDVIGPITLPWFNLDDPGDGDSQGDEA